MTVADCAAQAAVVFGLADAATHSDQFCAITTGRLDWELGAFRFAFASILRQASAVAGVPIGSICWPDTPEFCAKVLREGTA